MYSDVFPSPGTYGIFGSFNFVHNDISSFVLSPAMCRIVSSRHNVSDAEVTVDGNLLVDSNGINMSSSVEIGYDTSVIEFLVPLGGLNSQIGIDGNARIWFQYDKPPGDTAVSPDISNGSSSADNQLVDNTQQMVEKQDTIIDQIMNVTQTISSQLTAFWNQLAGEFTNLYNKMNTQHSEQMQSDQDTRDTIQEEEEKSRNFIVDGIIEGLKSLFIPSDEYFKAYFDDLLEWFSDRFGFLSFPVELLVKMIDLFVNSSDIDCVLTLPSFSIDGHMLWDDMSFNLTEFLETDFPFLLAAIRTVSSIGLIMMFIRLCEDKWDEVMNN